MNRLILFLLAALMSGNTPAATLKIATLLPDGTSWMKLMREGAQTIDARTQGRVKLRFYPGGVMGNDSSVMRKIRAGQLHGGALTAGGLAALDDNIQSYSLPFLFQSLDEVDYVRQRMDSTLIESLEKNGFISFGLSEGGFVYLMSQYAITQVGQLQFHKVWTPEGDRISERAFRALGVTPIPLPLTDVLTGLQTGLIDTIGTSPAAAIALQWHTRVKYLTDMPALYLYGSLVFKASALNSLSPNDRKILSATMGETIKKINDATRSDNSSARQALENQGIQILKPSAKELDEWLAEVGSAIRGKGNTDEFSSPAIREQIDKLLREYRTSHR
ncbi:MAG: TRAP transporter substrate-binding protein DctP [Gammaproteobacteria bacterium]|nr:TRAP transporter substrate-binding protein DctP [Gammaproteobacteria bacterium]